MTIDKSIGERLKLLIERVGVSQNVVSKQLNVPQSFLSSVITGKNGISAKMIINFTIAYKDIDLRWLLTGEGEMWMPAPAYPTTVVQAASDVVEECPGRYDVPESNLSAVVEDHERRLQALEQKK